jgi:hypothetical protein
MRDLGIDGEGTAINEFGEIAGSPGLINGDGTTTYIGIGDGSINNFGQVAGDARLYTPGTGTVQMSSLLPFGSPMCGGQFCWQWWIHTMNDAQQMTGYAHTYSTYLSPFALWFEPVTSPLSAFQANLQLAGKGETHVRMRGSFSLATGSNGFDPTQPVLLQLGSLPLAIRKGSFK